MRVSARACVMRVSARSCVYPHVYACVCSLHVHASARACVYVFARFRYVCAIFRVPVLHLMYFIFVQNWECVMGMVC